MNLIFTAIFLTLVQVPLKGVHFVELKGERFHVSLAQTPHEWARGLMFRERLGENEGMLFIGDREKPQTFWMKNTPVSLDIVFISKDWRVVDIKENTTPFSEEPLTSKMKAMHVLEIKGGRSKSMGLKDGDRVLWIKP